jgi:hypothetical protein
MLVFDKVDENKNGLQKGDGQSEGSSGEFELFVKHPCVTTAFFNVLDVNGNGSLSKGEFTTG